jgi:hypothetical protein
VVKIHSSFKNTICYLPFRCFSGRVAHLMPRVLAAYVRPWRISIGGKTRSSPNHKADSRFQLTRQFDTEGELSGDGGGEETPVGTSGYWAIRVPDAGIRKATLFSYFSRVYDRTVLDIARRA